MVDPNLFNFVNMAWEPYTCTEDCFPSAHNGQLELFHSKFWCPGMEAVDTFTVNWDGEVCWLVSPL